ncbi:MAG: hypothetical protein AAFP09_18765, partial [Cyanobacteria bacterium J06607_10]
MAMKYQILSGLLLVSALFVGDARAQEMAEPVTADSLNLPPDVVEQSPVLQRWLNEVPDVADDIRHDPSFATR